MSKQINALEELAKTVTNNGQITANNFADLINSA